LTLALNITLNTGAANVILLTSALLSTSLTLIISHQQWIAGICSEALAS
jgi:hypothetical protein